MGSSSFAVANVRELDSEDRGQHSAERRLNTAPATLDRRLEHLRVDRRLARSWWFAGLPRKTGSMKSVDFALSSPGLGFLFAAPGSHEAHGTRRRSVIKPNALLSLFLFRNFWSMMLVRFPSLGNGSTFWILHNFETVCGIYTVDVHPGTTRDLSVLKMSIIFARQLRLTTIFFFAM